MSGAFIPMLDHLPLPIVPPYVEVSSPDGKVWRFAAGTKAGFAVSRIKRKTTDSVREILCIEAVKEGEEPVEFGPDAELVNYGENWKLQIVQETGYVPGKHVHQENVTSGLNRENVGATLHLARVANGPNHGRVGAESAECKAGTELPGRISDIKDIGMEIYPGGKLAKGMKQGFSSSERRKRSRNWNLHEIILLVQAKKDEWERYESPSDRSKYEPAAEKWARVAECLQVKGIMDRDVDQCRGKWDNLLSDFKTINEWHRKVDNVSYASLSREEKRQHKLPSFFDPQIMDLLDTFYGRRPGASHLFGMDHSACQSHERDDVTDEADHCEGDLGDGFISQKKRRF